MILVYLTTCMVSIWVASLVIQSLCRITMPGISAMSAGLLGTGLVAFAFGSLNIMEPVVVLIAGLIYVPAATIALVSSAK